MSIGLGLSSFVDSYQKAARIKQADEQNELRFATAAQALNDRRQEQQDLATLARVYQERRATTGADPLRATHGPGGPAVLGGAPSVGGIGGPGMPPGIPPPPPGAPPAPPPDVPQAGPGPRPPLLDALSPEVAGRILSRPTTREAFKDLRAAEREAEADRNRQQAETIFSEAVTSLKAGDSLGFYDKMSRAQRLLGNHDRAGQYLEHALNLRQDKEEREKADADLGAWIKAKGVYEADPSPANYQAFLEALGQAESKAGRSLRQQILGNVVAKTFNQNPQVTSFNRAVARGYMQAFQAGKTPDPETIFKQAAAANPAGFHAYLFDAMANGKKIPEVVLKKVLRWDVPDTKEIPKDVYAFSFARTQAMMPGVRPDDPKFLERWNQELVRVQKQLSKAKAAEKEEDPDKSLRTDLDSLRKRLADVRTNLRQKDLAGDDPERRRLLLEEEQQIKSDLRGLEDRARSRGLLGPKTKATLKSRPPGLPRPAPGDDDAVEAYRNRAKAEFNRLLRSGYSEDEAFEAMVRGGWDVGE